MKLTVYIDREYTSEKFDNCDSWKKIDVDPLIRYKLQGKDELCSCVKAKRCI